MSRERYEKICVLCVGSSGAGKSTLIKKMTLQDIEVNAGAKSVTQGCQLFSKAEHGLQRISGLFSSPKLYFIDTQGWEDSSYEVQDNQIFFNIFKFLKENKITHIKCVIWSITPQERMTATLHRQARLINIWDNVLIVCKKMTDNNLAIQGAKEAAELIQRETKDITTNINFVGFTIIDDERVQEKIKIYKAKHEGVCKRSKDATQQHPQPNGTTSNPNKHSLEEYEFCKNKNCNVQEQTFVKCTSEVCKTRYEELTDLLYVFDDEAIRKNVGLLIDNCQAIEIIYKIQKCKSCGEENDVRLMSNKCHTNHKKSHGEIKCYHPKDGKLFHSGREPPYHKVEGKPSFRGTKFSCCATNEWTWRDKLMKKGGCVKVWDCCQKEKNSDGCSQVAQFDCCSVKRKKHRCDPIKKHSPVTLFLYPGHAFNPWNWKAKYITLCHHDLKDPGCLNFYPCCSRFEDDPKGGCTLDEVDGCKIECIWCKEKPTGEGCRKICKECNGTWGDSPGCTVLPEKKTHDVMDIADETFECFEEEEIE